MKKGPDRFRPGPRVPRDAAYCFVCEADDDWFVEAELDGWFAEAELAGWFAEAELAGWFAEAELDGWFAEAELDGWFAEAELDGWFAEAELADVPPAESRPAICAPAAFAWSMAACVRGPMTPSTGPGSKPLSFSACWSWRTDSSPWAWLPELDEADALPVELEAIDEGWFVEAEAEGWLVEAEADGWLVDAGWFDEAEADGWLVEADVALLSAAITEPAAMRAATRASLRNSMVGVLSDGQLTAIRFGAIRKRRFRGARAPCGARQSAEPRRRGAT